MAPLTIDWMTATVHDGTLTVELSQTPSSKWRQRAKGAIGLLERPGQAWGEIGLKNGQIAVAGLSEGGEDEVRHHLESIVLQANGGERDPDQPPDDADGRMSAAFQAFAG